MSSAEADEGAQVSTGDDDGSFSSCMSVLVFLFLGGFCFMYSCHCCVVDFIVVAATAAAVMQMRF